MKSNITRQFLIFLVVLLIGTVSCNEDNSETSENPFWGDGSEVFETQKLYNSERSPNVVVAMDGSIVTTWGRNSHQVRRSEDGGQTWGPLITVSAYNWWQDKYPIPGFQGGGLTVDENTGDILTFVEDGHPPSPLYVFRSEDHGKTWKQEEVTIHPDSKGNMPSFHMNEGGDNLETWRARRPTNSADQVLCRHQ